MLVTIIYHTKTARSSILFLFLESDEPVERVAHVFQEGVGSLMFLLNPPMFLAQPVAGVSDMRDYFLVLAASVTFKPIINNPPAESNNSPV